MANTADIGTKRLIGLSPERWAQWVTQTENLKVLDLIDGEFQWVSRTNDVLLKVSSPELGTFLLLNELQLTYKPEMPRRMRAYSALAEEKFGLPVYPVLINLLMTSKNQVIPQCYESEFNGIRAYQDYRVINLWEVDVRLVFEQGLENLLPFTPIMKSGGNEATVSRALRLLRGSDRFDELEPLLTFFASYVLDEVSLQQIMRWDMAILDESPLVRRLLSQGEQKGEANLVLRQLSRRFGTLPQGMTEQIRQLGTIQLESFGEALLDFTQLSEVEDWLAGNS